MKTNISLSQITNVASVPECRPLKETRFWRTNVGLISSHMLQVLQAELEEHHGHTVADACMNSLVEHALYDYLSGRIDNESLLMYQLPIRASDIAAAIKSLNQLAGMEKLAVMFSLVEGITLTDSVRLAWDEIDYKALQPVSVSMLRSTPVHMDVPYVFWRLEPDHDDHPIPLFGFVRHFTELSGMTWKRFAKCISIAEIDFTNSVVKGTNHMCIFRPLVNTQAKNEERQCLGKQRCSRFPD
ncbi:hypothetical protein NX722_21160 [Endozoicomonas gorgoniicola]|uniref:Heme NO-binding domain-containing protein n=1 Tax=Endozoicomonas gorgoniicola TaxID=1234144 RepID=A0ABT3N0C9_9GAMM|nr:hypothetical protein [Endozoicomonas gorgoniicola]MCW7555085.1 hypothetical protein [Endozoicomonas gorgoniicola]